MSRNELGGNLHCIGHELKSSARQVKHRTVPCSTCGTMFEILLTHLTVYNHCSHCRPPPLKRRKGGNGCPKKRTPRTRQEMRAERSAKDAALRMLTKELVREKPCASRKCSTSLKTFPVRIAEGGGEPLRKYCNYICETRERRLQKKGNKKS